MKAHTEYREMLETCPACGCTEALLALGTRYDRPHRWRPWITTRTELYLCDRCDAIVTVPTMAATMARQAILAANTILGQRRPWTPPATV